MSEFWKPDAARGASALNAMELTGGMQRPPFVPWAEKFSSGFASSAALAPQQPHFDEPMEATIDLDAIRDRAFADGYNEGRRTVEMEVGAERDAVARLAEMLEQYRPEPPAELAALLAETVDRLVRQIVGEAVIDADLLDKRVAVVAQLIADTSAPRRMRLHPDDIRRLEGADLDVEIIPDASMLPGSVFVETGTGWVEDGPDVGLEKLRQALERMGISQ